MIHYSNIDATYWLSYDYLLKHSISEDVIGQWSKRNVCDRTYVEGKAYINYDTIPAPSRAKLPSKEELRKEYSRQQYAYREEYFLEELREAYNSPNVRRWDQEIQKIDFGKWVSPQEITVYARRAAVYERAIELHNRRKGGFSALFYAFKTLYPDNSYKNTDRFHKALAKAEEEGILSVAIDKRKFRKTPVKYGALHEYYAFGLLSSKNNFTLEEVHERLLHACRKEEIETPSFSWLRLFSKKNYNLIEDTRKGKTKDAPIYAKIIPALNAGSQWQIDGWTLPFWCKKPNGKGGYEKYVRYILFAVMDAHSRKIVGFHVAESENTETILKGLEKAVKHTGYLSFEIVADNHSWNNTKIADNIKEKFAELDVVWTIDSNPRRKAIVERSFRTLGDKHFKHMYGYLGQGVKTKVKKGKVAQELLDKYGKTENMLTYDQIVANAVLAVHEYNNSIIKKLKDTPNNLYEKSEKPHIKPVDDFTRMGLFFRESEATIRNGQITIQRGAFNKYEYQLPAEYFEQWNNKTVAYRRGDSFEYIYLYDIETGTPICCLSQKSDIHGALADQGEKDKEQLFKNSGRAKGIESKAQKRKDKLSEEADTINPAAFGYLNELTTPKDTLAEVQRTHEMQRDLVEDYGIAPANILEFPEARGTLDPSLRTKENDMSRPFRVKEYKEMTKLIIK